MRSAPAPDLLPIPGMNQGTAVAAGDGGAGGGDGDGGDGNDKEGAGGGNGGDDATGDNRNAPDKEKYPTCGTESHPVDVVTGQVFTHPIVDLSLPGPLPFSFERSYSSTASRQDQGLGFGWAHSLGWFVEVMRNRVRVWNEKGVSVSFPIPQIGHSILGDWGWVVRRELWGFAVDANDDVWRIFSTSFDEGKSFRLTAIEDRNKNRVALTYDDGKLVEIKDSAGRTIKVKSNNGHRITGLDVKNAEHQGRWITFARYEYDDNGRLVRATDADGYSWTYEYDEHNRLVRDTDRVGLSFCFRYDTKDRGIEAWGEYAGKTDPSLADDVPEFLADGRTRAKGIYHRKLDYHRNGYTEVTDTTEIRKYFGNKKGTLDKAVTGGAVTTSEYDERGFEILKSDPLGATTLWRRDGRGRPIEIVDPLNRCTRIERDPHGLPIVVIDASGGVTRAERDERGNVHLLQDAVGGTGLFTRDSRGLVTSITTPIGARTEYLYDSAGNLVEVVQANGGRWLISYDELGRRLSIVDPAGVSTTYAYSTRGDLVAVYNASGGATRYAYDGERHPTQLLSANGHATRFLWGGFHKVCAKQDANGHTVRLSYSREGELVAVHNERGEVHRLTYDHAGRLVGETTFDGREISYRNDLAGRRVRVENGAGETATFVYDPAGQMIARELHEGDVETFAYNARGELIGAKSSVGEFRFERDAVGRVVREVQLVGSQEHWVEAAYDNAGNRVERRTSLGHREILQRDAMGARSLTILDTTTRIGHVQDIFACEVRRMLPSGGVIESSFDPEGRLVGRIVRAPSKGPSPLAGEPEWLGKRDDGVTAATSYDYNAVGDLVSKNDRGRGSTRFEYDPLGRLVAAVPEQARGEFFSYDASGNIQESAPGAPRRVYAAGNRLLARGNVEYKWDDNGRLTRKIERGELEERVWSYEWNSGGLLAAVTTPEHVTVDFTYDPFARRVSKRVRVRDGTAYRTLREVRFLWDNDSLAHEIRVQAAEAGDPIVEERAYAFEDDGIAPLAQRVSGAWEHYVNDPSGSAERLLAGDGSILAEVRRTVWGEEDSSDGGGPRGAERETRTPFGFAGQYADPECGLSYNRFRYYDPATGLYISPDPVRLRAGLRVYAYVPNPLTWIDPLGLNSKGNAATKAQLDAIRDAHLAAHPDHTHVAGGRDCKTGQELKEEYFPGPGGGTTGSVRPDLTFEAPDGTRHRYQTVDVAPTRPSGMSTREEENAARLFQQTQPGDTLTLVPKPVPGASQVNMGVF